MAACIIRHVRGSHVTRCAGPAEGRGIRLTSWNQAHIFLLARGPIGRWPYVWHLPAEDMRARAQVGDGTDEVAPEDNMLRIIFDKGPVTGFKWDDFDTVRARAAGEWQALPLFAQPLSYSLKDKINRQMQDRGKQGVFLNNGSV